MAWRAMVRRSLARLCLAALAVMAVIARPVGAQDLAGAALIDALRGGGYTLYFRHAATDWSQSDRVAADGDWTSCAPADMRQLSDAGRATARRLGVALRALEIPVAKVLSSEYCRAAETARLMALGPVRPTRDIMNLRAAAYVGGRDAAVARVRRQLAKPVPPGGNVVIVAHGNLMRAATGAYPGEAGSGVFKSDPASELGFVLVAELAAGDWLQLAAQIVGD